MVNELKFELKTLETICFEYFLDSVKCDVEKVLSRLWKNSSYKFACNVKNIVRKCLLCVKVLPHSLQDELGNKLLLYFEELHLKYYDSEHIEFIKLIIIDLFEIVLNLKIKKFNSNKFVFLYLYNLHCNLHKLRNLKHLELHPWTENVENILTNALPNMKNLSTLNLQGNCTDEIVEILSENCKQLENLDVSNSEGITNICIKSLTKCKNLNEIYLANTSIDILGCVKLLSQVPNLTSFSHHEIPTVLERFAKKTTKKLNLTYINLRESSTTHTLQLVADLCPKLEKIEIFNINKYAVLAPLNKLREIKIVGGSFVRSGFDDLFKQIGNNIRSLQFYNMYKMDKKALISIGLNCPRLEEMTIKSLQGRKYKDYSSQNCTNSKEEMFKNLNRLTFHEYVDEWVMEFLLTNCKELESINCSYYMDSKIFVTLKKFTNSSSGKVPIIKVSKLKNLSDTLVEYLKPNCNDLYI